LGKEILISEWNIGGKRDSSSCLCRKKRKRVFYIACSYNIIMHSTIDRQFDATNFTYMSFRKNSLILQSLKYIGVFESGMSGIGTSEGDIPIRNVPSKFSSKCPLFRYAAKERKCVVF
jgi:hypothetical protein